MSLKLKRIHFSGISNLDFRTKGDKGRIKFYQPYHESKAFGIQGLSNYKLPPSIHQQLFSPTKGLNEGKFIKNEMPNPKIYEAALFYRNKSMNIKPNVFLRVERAKQLDTSEYRGGGEYNGDSMMISETVKKRKEIKMKEKLQRDNIKKRFNGDMYGDLSYNKNKDLTTALSYNDKGLKKSKSDVLFMDKKIKKERLNMIRNKIFNRLFPHDNTKGIFIQWQNDYLNNREVSTYDLHKIINDLGIPITYNEAFALISSANKRNTDKLNYDEFKDFFLNGENINKDIDIDLSKIPYQQESSFEEKHKKEEENKINQFKDLSVQKSDSFLKFEKLTRNNHPNFLRKLSKTADDKQLDGKCDLPTFKKIIKTMKIPDKCKNEEVINSIYNKYKMPNKDLMDYEKMIEGSKHLNEENNFFRFQNGYLGLIHKKLEKNKEERKRYNEILEENDKRKKSYLNSQLASMRSINLRKSKSNSMIVSKNILSEINKEKQYFLEKQNNTELVNGKDKEKDKEIANNIETDLNNNKTSFHNHYQPSLEFINFVFKDNKLYNDRYYQSIKEISPLIQAKNNDNTDLSNKNSSESNKINFEFVINSKKYNKNFLSDDTDDDKKRFKFYELSQEEKKNKIKYLENSLKRKFDTNRKWNDKIDFQQQVADINNSLGQIKRTESLYRYEKKIHDLNSII